MIMSHRLLALLLAAGVSVPAIENAPAVLVELFTSEGCSSCPPADRLLDELSHQAVPGAIVIALSEHVDYWDHLGWRDPYSSSQFSLRQQAYSQVFRLDSVYTPQMVVDGLANFIGSDGEQARKMIHYAALQPKASVSISRRDSDGRVALRVEKLGVASVEKADVFLAMVESGLESAVASGENAGRRLRHTGVVRRLTHLQNVEAKRGAYNAELKVDLRPEWKRENMRAVVFVQDLKTRRIVGAASCGL
jgi:hypothetical protein